MAKVEVVIIVSLEVMANRSIMFTLTSSGRCQYWNMLNSSYNLAMGRWIKELSKLAGLALEDVVSFVTRRFWTITVNCSSASITNTRGMSGSMTALITMCTTQK
jgi:hypothetical protein